MVPSGWSNLVGGEPPEACGVLLVEGEVSCPTDDVDGKSMTIPPSEPAAT
jgi:hypothetical protein